MLREKNPALLLVDIQKGLNEEAYYGGNRNNKDAEIKMKEILELWRKLQLPIIHIQHQSLNPASPLHGTKKGFEQKDELKKQTLEHHFIKHENSAFINTGLDALLKQMQISTLVIMGLTTNHCVSSTVRMAANLGYETLLIEDACATFDIIDHLGQKHSSELVHNITIGNLKDEFAQIWSARNIIEQL